MKRTCDQCGGKLHAHYYREARCQKCGDVDYMPVKRPSPPPISDEAYDRVVHERNDALAMLQALRDVLSQGEWLQSLAPDGSDGYQMDGGLWMDGETFDALFPDRAEHPHITMLSSPNHPVNGGGAEPRIYTQSELDAACDDSAQAAAEQAYRMGLNDGRGS